jgi:hypothetical protein
VRRKENVANDSIKELKNLNPDALRVVQRLLEHRVGSAVNKSDNLDIRIDIARTYSILARIIEEVQDELEEEEEVTQIKNLFVQEDDKTDAVTG